MKKLCALLLALALCFCLAPSVLAAPRAKAPKPSSITLNVRQKTLYQGEQFQLAVKRVKPQNAQSKVRWLSSNKSIATVDSKGLVRTKKAGTVRITATSTAAPRVKASILIRVKKGVQNRAITLNQKQKSLRVGESLRTRIHKEQVCDIMLE